MNQSEDMVGINTFEADLGLSRNTVSGMTSEKLGLS